MKIVFLSPKLPAQLGTLPVSSYHLRKILPNRNQSDRSQEMMVNEVPKSLLRSFWEKGEQILMIP